MILGSRKWQSQQFKLRTKYMGFQHGLRYGDNQFLCAGLYYFRLAKNGHLRPIALAPSYFRCTSQNTAQPHTTGQHHRGFNFKNHSSVAHLMLTHLSHEPTEMEKCLMQKVSLLTKPSVQILIWLDALLDPSISTTRLR